MKELIQAPHKREYDRIRKAKEYARKGIERQKEMMLRSFKENDNFFEAQARLNEMELVSSGVLNGEAGISHFAIFPDPAFNDPTYFQPYVRETQVVGCVPIHLMASLITDVKPDHRFKMIINLSQEIRRNDGVTRLNERGFYYMAHWKKSMQAPFEWQEQMTDDWKKSNEDHRIFSHSSVVQIETFGKAILKRLGFKTVTRSTHSFAPGLVYTEIPYPQDAHLDFDESNMAAAQKSWIIHMPLQKEGMLLSVWDLPIDDDQLQELSGDAKHQYMFVPFGSYIALRADVLHSGVYGSSGNSRFHMILKSRNQVQVAARTRQDVQPSILYYRPLPIDPNRPSWRSVFELERKRFHCYTTHYIRQLQDNTGEGVTDALLSCKDIKGVKRFLKGVAKARK